MSASSQTFRVDINGLRAWAVMAVVLYHFGVPVLSGGFAGVDVFFVISGFLMAGIVQTGLQRREFSLWHFYLARARRIVPALAVVCVCMLLLGWFYLMPEEYQQLGRHARESLLFSSNLRYLAEAGYFDSESAEKWLLHTWSLSVEWQFYLILPVLMLGLSRFLPGQRAALISLASLALLSFGLCMWRTNDAPSEAFYLLQFRAWEMLAGACVFMVGPCGLSRAAQRWFESIGFGLIVLALVVFSSSDAWPGWRAAVPVSGAMLVLYVARQQSLWTSGRVLQWLGTRSYSIYLWHWPAVVMLTYLDLHRAPIWIAFGVVASLVLGHLSYHLVEVPASRWLRVLSTRRAAVALVVGLVCVAALAQTVRLSGFPKRLPEAVAVMEAERDNHNPRMRECLDFDASCNYGSGPVRAILLGDSHADAVVTALQAALPNEGAVLFRGESGCLITFGLQRGGKEKSDCALLNARIERELSGYPAGVPMILVGRLSEHFNGGLDNERAPTFHFGQHQERFSEAFLAEASERYEAMVCTLARAHPVYLMRPTPEMADPVPLVVGRALLLGRTHTVSLSLADYQARHRFIWALQDRVAAQCNAQILDPLPYLCAEDNCPGLIEGRPLYRDRDHLSEFGNRLLVPMFKSIFTPLPNSVSHRP